MFKVDSVSGARSRSSRLSFGLVAAALMLLVTATGVLAGTGDKPVGSGTTMPPDVLPTATRVYPNAKIVDLHRTAWDHIRISANGHKLVVYFWMGPQACYGLGKVDVIQRGGTLKIKLWTGTQPSAVDMACPEIAQLYKTVIFLR